jgi:REP element-mobilizing transposase RayT
MSSKYCFLDSQAIYFTTSTVVAWADLFTREIYREILLDSIRYCQKNQGLVIHAWVLMTNHLHLICSFDGPQAPGLVLKNMKSFTAVRIIDAIIKNPKESRRSYLLDIFEVEAKKSSGNFRFQFWQHENHPVLLDSAILFDEKFNYVHWNPVSAGLVDEPWHWRNSSAVDYMTGQKGLLEIRRLE